MLLAAKFAGLNRVAPAIIAAAVVLGPCLALGAHRAVRTNIDSYFVLGLRQVQLKDLDLRDDLGVCGSPTAAFLNVGVNCENPGTGNCGTLTMEEAEITSTGQESQVVGDIVRFPRPGGSTFGQQAAIDMLYRNNTVLNLLPSEVIFNDPPEQSFITPLIPGTCDSACEPDYDAVRTLCGFPVGTITCDKVQGVLARPGQDCLPYDSNVGNGHCDLPPGTYGFVRVTNDAVLELQIGSYEMCSIRVGHRGRLSGNGAVLNIVGGSVRGGNGSSFGNDEVCDDLTVNYDGTRSVAFGRGSLVSANVCAPRAKVKLGHGNNLTGRFIGDKVASDRNNIGHVCCH